MKNLKDNKKTLTRTRSDDAYQRLLKYNEESLKRAIADGYRNFMIPKICDEDETPQQTKSTKSKPIKQEIRRGITVFNTLNINNLKHNKYITRTSNAGTIIIKEDSFSNPNWRRRNSDYNNLDNKDNQTIIHPNLPYTNNNNENVKSVRNTKMKYSKSVSSIKRDKCYFDVNSNYIVQEPSSENSRKNSEVFMDNEKRGSTSSSSSSYVQRSRSLSKGKNKKFESALPSI